MKINYLDLLKRSWGGVRKNLILFLPVIISILLFIGFLVLLGIELIVFVLIFSKSILSQPTAVFSSLPGVAMLILFGLVDFVLMLMLGSYVRSMQIGMYKDVVERGETSFSNMFKYGKLYFMRYLKYSFIRFLIFFIPALILGLIVYVIFLESKLLALFIGIIAFFIFLAYTIFVALGLFFIEPIIAFRKQSITDLIKYSFNYTIKNIGHVLLTWFIMFIVSICVSISLSVFLVPMSILESVLKQTGPASALIFVFVLRVMFEIARAIINAILIIILDLFRFNAYFAKRIR